MALHYGIFNPERSRKPEELSNKYFTEEFPKTPLMEKKDWEAIRKFYLYISPEKLKTVKSEPVPHDTPFEVIPLKMEKSSPPSITAVLMGVESSKVWLADQNSRQLMAFNGSGKLQNVLKSSGAVSQIHIRHSIGGIEQLTLANIGFSIKPTEASDGFVETLTLQGDSLLHRAFVKDWLKRPVSLMYSDWTGDGMEELAIGNFGKNNGDFTIYSLKQDDQWEELFKIPEPGTVAVRSHDFFGNGKEDILVLFAQGNERIVLLENHGGGSFDNHLLLEFPPSYGSTSLDIVDFNGDGLPDILYTCGDNADLSPILKPYHGIYVFLNEGGNKFEEAYFYPFPGAYKAIAGDFTGNGLPDIAAISFFSDYADGDQSGFVLLENNGFPDFLPSTLPIGHLGRWICMDVGDLDGDGTLDIVLGNYSRFNDGVPVRPSWQKGPHALILKNTIK